MLDTLGMWEATAALPEQVSGALAAADDVFAPVAPAGAVPSVRRRVRPGHRWHGLAAAGALTAPDLTVPFWVGHGSAVPAFVGTDTLVLAVSSSGGTAETLTAAEKAVEQGPRSWPWEASPTARWPPWRSTRDCPGARRRHVRGTLRAEATVPRRAPCWVRRRWPCSSRWPGRVRARSRGGGAGGGRDAGPAPGRAPGAGRAAGDVGPPARPHHPAGLRRRPA